MLDGANADVAEFLADHVPETTVLSWPERRGLAAGLNAAFRATSCSYVAVLQDDAVPQAGWLASLLHTAARYPRAGVVGSLVLSVDGTVQSAGAIVRGEGGVVMPWIDDAPPATSFTEVRAADYVGSSSVLVSRAAWSAIGGFDEDLYPAVYVDADFCTGLWHAGWLVLLDPHSVVCHERHGSTTRPFREFLYQRNRVRFMAKWGSFVGGRPTGPPNASEVEAAIERASRWLAEPPGPSPRSGDRPPVAAAPIVYVARERDLLRAYVAELEPRLDGLEERIAELDATYEALSTAHHELESDHAEVEAAYRELESAHRDLASTHDHLESAHRELRRTPWRPIARRVRRLLRPRRRTHGDGTPGASS